MWGLVPGPPSEYGLNINGRVSRGHDLKLIIDLSNVNNHKYAFSQRVSHIWNYLDASTVYAPSIRAFKLKLLNYDFKNFLVFET